VTCGITFTFGGLRVDADCCVLDEGGQIHLGVVPCTGTQAPDTGAVLDRVRRVLDMIGFDPAEVVDQLVLTPACGLAGASASYARAALAAVHEAAHELG